MNESKSTRHQRSRRRRRAAGLAVSAAALGLLAFSPLSRLLATWAERAASVTPGWAQPVTTLVLFVLVVVVVVETPALSIRLAGGRLFRRALVSEVHVLLALVPAAVLAAGVIQISVRAVGSWWWLVSGLAIATGLLLAMHAAPVLVARLAGATPLRSQALASRIAALSRRAGVPVSGIDEVTVDDEDESTAFVAGLGQQRRVFLASTVVRDWCDEEIEVVVAHELGHHRRGDLWRTLGLAAPLLVAALVTAELVLPPTLAPGRLAALPAVAWIAAGVWLVTAPLRHAQSRHHEREADAFALAITGGADAFSTVVRRLGSRRLADERPSWLTRWMTYRHPSVGERLAAAETHRTTASTVAGRRR